MSLVLIFFSTCIFEIACWHGYQNLSGYQEETSLYSIDGKICSMAYKDADVVIPINDNNPHKLWPNLTREQDLKNGKSLFGFHAAIKTIWNHQHPTDCSRAKFMITRC
mmetsp:Transcript_12227/g.12312  ORF Transcript_12227/g.12312 Transcript_12227/m.12312 type:complete len:108 (+) Transcript_12227:67-390(+)